MKCEESRAKTRLRRGGARLPRAPCASLSTGRCPENREGLKADVWRTALPSDRGFAVPVTVQGGEDGGQRAPLLAVL